MTVPISNGRQRGLILAGDKAAAASQPLTTATPPAQLYLSLALPDGNALLPCVAPGDPVLLGQVVAWPADDRAVPLHSPVSGRIVGIEHRLAIGAATPAPTLIIDNDGRDARDPSATALPEYTQSSPQDLVARIAAGGIVGLGGAAFPTHLKLAPRAPVAMLLLNGVECEPGISCDDALMRERATDVVFGAQVMLHALGATKCVIAIEADKPEAMAAMTRAVQAAADERLKVSQVAVYYPAGGEKQLIAAVCGQEVPADGLPCDIGVVCQNVGTAAAIATLVKTGEPLIRRIVTVTGRGVLEPRNLEARLGTPFRQLIDDCGGYTGAVRGLIAGGSMMGEALADDAAGLAKSTHCVIAATPADLDARPPPMPCIRCGDCAEVCPAILLPQELYRYARAADDGNLARLGLADCIECGCCDVVCPSHLPLTATFRAARSRLADAQRQHDARESARQRFAAHTRRLADEQAARQRKLKDKRPGGTGEG